MSLQGEHEPSAHRIPQAGLFGRVIPASLVPLRPEDGLQVSLGVQSAEAIPDPGDPSRQINPKYADSKASRLSQPIDTESAPKPVDRKKASRDVDQLRRITAAHKILLRRSSI